MRKRPRRLIPDTTRAVKLFGTWSRPAVWAVASLACLTVTAAGWGPARARTDGARALVQPAQTPPGGAGAQSEQEATAAAQQQAIAAFEAGQQAHQRGDLAAAIEHYTTALELIPDFPEALYQRGMAHLSLKQFDRAQKDLRRLAHMEAKLLSSADGPAKPQLRRLFARVHSALGDILSQGGDPAKAEQNYRRAIELDPHLRRATTSLASLLIERKAFDEAAARLRAAVEAGVVSAEVYSLLGYVYEQQGQPDQAVTSYSKAIELDPHSRLARDRRSRLRAEHQDYQGAIEDFAVVYQQDHSAAHAQRLAALYQRAGKPDEAIDLYERALKQATSPAEAKRLRLKLIDLLTSAHRPQEAVAQTEQLVRQHPDDADAHARLGRRLLSLNPARAAEAYQRALGLDPQNVDYQVGLSAALIKMKRYQDALSVSLDALKRAPENYYVHSDLATAYFQLHEFAQAAEQFKWITEHRPNLAIPFYFLGICYDKLMEYELALAAYERFLELADANQYQMQIDNVKFRLPGLRRAIKKGRGRHHR